MLRISGFSMKNCFDYRLLKWPRHEVPVCAEDIRILHMDDDIVVVDKPASIPVSKSELLQINSIGSFFSRKVFKGNLSYLNSVFM